MSKEPSASIKPAMNQGCKEGEKEEYRRRLSLGKYLGVYKGKPRPKELEALISRQGSGGEI